MAFRDKRSSYFPIKIPVNTLSGGVGRQAPSKRLPSEAEELTNMFCTNERSLDKRSAFRPLSDSTYTFLNIDNPEEKDLWYYWFEVNEDTNYLIVLDYRARGTDQEMLWVFKVSNTSFNVQAVEVGEDINHDCRAYITYGSEDANNRAKDVLKAVSIGSTIVVLNTLVKAGYSSDGVERQVGGENGHWLHNLDGTVSTTSTDIDQKGRPIEYQTTLKVDPQGLAEYWTSVDNYVWGQDVISPENYKIYTVKDNLGSTSLPGPQNGESIADPSTATANHWDDTGRVAEFIPVEEYLYPDPDKQYLGQSVARFSDLRFPPDGDGTVASLGDSYKHNGDIHVRQALAKLYPLDGPLEDEHRGKGKIIYLSQAYLSSSPGWYRVINEVKKPYLKKVRTPDKMSVLDDRRMPMQIFISGIPSNTMPNGGWRIRKIGWDPRTAGTATSNPGPSPFKDENGKAVQKNIQAIAFYRDRLFLSTDDTLFSSRLGDFDNFFISDPATVEFRDPIDLKVSSNKYTPITYLLPYRDFLFLATSGETQYELMGSENQISPLSAEIAPTSFYPMTDNIAPILLNNNLFFYANNRLYIYFGSTTDSPQQAFEVSRPAPNYLPSEFYDVTASAAHNTLFVVEEDGGMATNNIFCFRNVISQEQILQNAFFKFTTSTGNIQSINAMGDYLYIVSAEDTEGNEKLAVHKMYLYPDEPDIPRLDRLQKKSFECVFNSELDESILTLSGGLQSWDQGVIDSGSREGDILHLTFVGYDDEDPNKITYSAKGDWSSSSSMWIGSAYTARAILSPLYVRDEANNVIPGSFNLRYGVFRHFNTGQYNVSITRKNREPITYTFNPRLLGSVDSNYGSPVTEENGTFKFSILGFSDDITIELSSDFPHAMNITNMEFTGKFKRLPHFLTS